MVLTNDEEITIKRKKAKRQNHEKSLIDASQSRCTVGCKTI